MEFADRVDTAGAPALGKAAGLEELQEERGDLLEGLHDLGATPDLDVAEAR